MKRLASFVLLLTTPFALDACGSSETNECDTGAEGCACYGNGTCDKGLGCYSHLCVDLSKAGDYEEPQKDASPSSNVAESDAAANGAPGHDDDAATPVTKPVSPSVKPHPVSNPQATSPAEPSSVPELNDADAGATIPAPGPQVTEPNATPTDSDSGAPTSGESPDSSTPTETEPDPAPAPDATEYEDVQLIASCSGSRGEVYNGAWFAIAGPTSSIVPADSSGTFQMSSGGFDGTAAHVTGTNGEGDYATLGHVMYLGSALFDASAYAGISFEAKATAPLSVGVALAQENNDPSYGLCVDDVSCYDYPRITLEIGTSWQRFVVLFSELKADPSLPDLAVTPDRIKHWQFEMPAGDFDFWVDDLYFVNPAQ